MPHDLSHLVFLDGQTARLISTLSLHDALPISLRRARLPGGPQQRPHPFRAGRSQSPRECSRSILPIATPSAKDRKSTRLNSSHSQISYAVFCLKKKSALRLSLLRRAVGFDFTF